ncbi:oligosaccharide flippase family protein [Saccharophagus degradans]|uniref:Polysaccharide biosynthesis C-terminal domain-containing protein n=1 Tax=Saccharophagus degradans TaxID=86304 RepID=A0AAW7X331_9GAMM|nr:polysaccharide biosynthesis C-terminal domain-containing protein [Saccharophagus degradans]MDO6421061.1 polysaccharide biosynthesis C-terminal domain-containing protein [Saccharophagus degradans]MDO6606028.1 polysaccharide biosynthesis C-terminal domain-containing protein [Saccharophagus degradans]
MIKNVLYVFTTKLSVVATVFLTSVVLARGLGVEGRGELATILLIPQIVLALAEGGMRQAATHYVGGGYPKSDILGVLVAYAFLGGGVGFVASALLLNYVISFRPSLLVVCLASAVVPLELLVSYLRGFFLGAKNFNRFNLALLLPKLAYLVFLLLFVLFGGLNVYYVVGALLLSVLLNLSLLLYLAVLRDGCGLYIDWKLMAAMFKVGVVYAIALFLINSNYKIDLLIIDHFLGSLATGVYVVAAQVGEMLWQLPGAIVVVLMAASASEKKDEIAVSAVCFACRITLTVTLFLAILLLIGKSLLIGLVFGQDYMEASGIILFLVPGLTVMVIFKVVNSYYAGVGRPSIALYVMIPAVLINVVCNFILIPTMGGKGAAIASSLSYFCASLGILIFFAAEKKVPLVSLLFMSLDDLSVLKKKIYGC